VVHFKLFVSGQKFIFTFNNLFVFAFRHFVFDRFLFTSASRYILRSLVLVFGWLVRSFIGVFVSVFGR